MALKVIRSEFETGFTQSRRNRCADVNVWPAKCSISVLARSRNHVDAFIDQYIRPLDGVVDTEVTYISKTMRFVSPEEWQKHMGPYLVRPGRERIKDIDADDDGLIAGC